MKKNSTALIVGLFVLLPLVSNATEVTFSWDANTEEDLAGYKIYYGAVSRSDLDRVQPIVDERIKKICKNETNIKSCTDEMKAFCAEEQEPSCHASFFSYDKSVDVGNVTTYTMKKLADGHYYAAATAYDTDKNESLFSIEVPFKIDDTAPNIVLHFTAEKKRSVWQVTVEELN